MTIINTKFNSPVIERPILSRNNNQSGQEEQIKFENQDQFKQIPYYVPIGIQKISFGHLQKDLKEFDIETLQDKKISEEFEPVEFIPPVPKSPDDYINVSAITTTAYGYRTDEIRHFLNTGELISYKQDSIVQECKDQGLSKEEIQERIEEEKVRFKETYERELEIANANIEKTHPLIKDHTVYRVVEDPGISEETKKYIEELGKLKPGEEVKLSTTPIYASTSPKRTLATYSCQDNPKILFKMNLKKGSKVFTFPGDGIEQLILKAGAKFKVVDNEEYKNNFRLITLDYLYE